MYGTRLLWQRKPNRKTHKIAWKAQPIGLPYFYQYPKTVAKFCGIKEWWKYAGHSVRATSASFYVEGQKTLLQLKYFGGWKSDKAAEGYYRNSVRNKNSDANVFNEVIGINETCVMEEDDEEETSKPSKKSLGEKHFSNCSFSNCTINF
eukprot:206358_1